MHPSLISLAIINVSATASVHLFWPHKAVY